MWRRIVSKMKPQQPTIQGKPLPPEYPLPKIPGLGHLPYLAAALVSEPGRLGKATAKMARMTSSPVFRTKFGALPVVILNDAKSVKEVFGLDKCNGRLKMLYEELYFPGSIQTESGEKYEKLRSTMLTGMKEYGMDDPGFEPMLDDEVNKITKALMAVEGQEKAGLVDFKHYAHGYAINATMWIIARHRWDMTSKEFEEYCGIVQETVGRGGYMAFYDLMPEIPAMMPDWLSGVAQARDRKDKIYNFLLRPVQDQVNTREPGEPRHLLDFFLDEILGKSRVVFTEYAIRTEILPNVSEIICASSVAGSALAWTLLHLAAHPFDQKNIQDEIDTLGLSKNETPSYDQHRSRMPYTMATICESLRLGSPAPLGYVHAADEDAFFDDFVIPKGTAILANLSQCHRDEKFWSNPEDFRPNRFLDAKSRDDKCMADVESFLPFGSGPRKCPGEPLAWRIMFRAVCGILKDYDLAAENRKRATDPNKTFPFVRTPAHNRLMVQSRADKMKI